MKLKDKVCIITGAANGIGREAVKLFSKEGAIVIACDILEEDLNNLKNECKEFGIVESYVLDVTDRQRVFDVVDEVFKEYGRIDVLINNAGITKDALLIRMKEKRV